MAERYGLCALALAKSFFPLWLVTSTDLLLLLLQTKVKGLEKNFCVVDGAHVQRCKTVWPLDNGGIAL